MSQNIKVQSGTTGDLLAKLKNLESYYGGVNISMDPGIEDNYYKHILYNQKNPEVLGYRILIYRGSGTNSENIALRVSAEFVSKYADIDAYPDFVTPDFVVYVGDCRTPSEALKLYYRVNREYPFSYVVPQQPIEPSYKDK
jgi:hypothetical protein